MSNIMQEELLKSRKWSARSRDAHDKFHRVWEARGNDYERQQQVFEETEAAQEEKNRQRREMEAAQVSGISIQQTGRRGCSLV